MGTTHEEKCFLFPPNATVMYVCIYSASSGKLISILPRLEKSDEDTEGFRKVKSKNTNKTDGLPDTYEYTVRLL